MSFQRQQKVLAKETDTLLRGLQTVDLVELLPQRMVVRLTKKHTGQTLNRNHRAEIRFIKTRI